MQVDYLTSRLDRLQLSSPQVAALAAIRSIRLRILNDVEWKAIANDEFIEEALRVFGKGQKPFQNWTLLEKLNWKKCSEIIRKLLRELVKSGLKNGSVQALTRDLETNHGLAFELCRTALNNKQEDFFASAAKYNVEPDLLRFILTTPLAPVFYRLRSILPKQEQPLPVTSCPVCGGKYSNGVYQAGYRFVICPVCNHRVRVDSFFCPSCGNTKPDEMGFVKPKEEPILQVDYCLRCSSYFKMVHEEIMGTIVYDAILLDLSTMDQDSVGREVLAKSGKARQI